MEIKYGIKAQITVAAAVFEALEVNFTSLHNENVERVLPEVASRSTTTERENMPIIFHRECRGWSLESRNLFTFISWGAGI